MYTVSPRRIPCRICGNYTAEQMVHGTFRTGPRPGFSLDPQDLATMYQDAQGTLPVYQPGSGAVDPPVGLMLDKSQGLELGPELVPQPLDFTQDMWVTATPGTTITGSNTFITDPGGGTVLSVFELGKSYVIEIEGVTTANKISVRSGPDAVLLAEAFAHTGGGAFSATVISPNIAVEVKTLYINNFNSAGTTTITKLSIREIKGYHAYQSTTTARPTLSGRYNLLTATETLSTQSVTTAATDYTLRFEGAGTVTLSGTATGTLSAGTHTIRCTAGTLTLTVAGTVTNADLRKTTAQNLPEYQAVADANTYDTTGFPLYLLRDMTDDEMLVQMPAMTGQRIAADFDAVTSAAGEYKPFGAVDAGPAECTQLLVVAAPSADEITVFERFAAEKGLLPGGV